MSSTRRQFLSTAGSFALSAAGTSLAHAAMGPNDKFDLVIKGVTCSTRVRTCMESVTSASALA